MTWVLADSHRSATTSLRTNCHEPANRVLTLAKSTSYAWEGAHQARGRNQWMNPKAIWVYSNDSTLPSSAENVSEVPWDLPRRYRRHRPLPSSPHGHFWKDGGPAVAGFRASGLLSTKPCSLPFHSHKLMQATLFFQNNEGGSASRERELSWHPIQICEQLLTRNYF